MKSANTTRSTATTKQQANQTRPTGTQIRKCVACQARKHKSEFVRIVKAKDAAPVFDPNGTMDGRGAYLCADATCLHNALKKGALNRALRCAIPDELRSTLEEVIKFRINCLD